MAWEITKKLANIVGPEHVTDSEVILATYSMSALSFKHGMHGLPCHAGHRRACRGST